MYYLFRMLFCFTIFVCIILNKLEMYVPFIDFNQNETRHRCWKRRWGSGCGLPSMFVHVHMRMFIQFYVCEVIQHIIDYRQYIGYICCTHLFKGNFTFIQNPVLPNPACLLAAGYKGCKKYILVLFWGAAWMLGRPECRAGPNTKNRK